MGTYGMKCQKGNLKFEMELTQYENADFLYVVRFKKADGDDLQYREISNRILTSMNL